MKQQKWTEDRVKRSWELYSSGKTLAEVAEIVGSNSHRVSEHLRKACFQTRKTGAPMERNRNWRGGRMIDKGGYILLKKKDHPFANRQGYVREHRLVVEDKLGRYLTPEEVVHHIDGNVANNHPDNLEVYSSNAEHLKRDLAGRIPKWSRSGKRRILAAKRGYYAIVRKTITEPSHP